MEQKKNNMATASMVMGIISIVLSCCCFMGFLFGGLAVLFACLSKVDTRFESRAKAGLITGIIGIVLGVVAIIGWFVLIIAGELSYRGELYGCLPAVQTMLKGGLL